ncbi:refilin-B isoform X2 [Denticeps clupeoides]|nr:refilin-B isoform X2 [Denticeps clupeoides]
MNPLEYFRRRHLSVTLLCEQSWCEVKVVCGLLRPLDKKAEMARPEVKMGAEIHLKKALEVHEEVPILVLSREDDEAVRALNVMQKIVTLETGMCVREFPVFGVLEGVFVMGFIDELSYDERGQLVLSELKTRRQMSIPRPAQIKRDGLQVRLYMLLFNGMISGSVSKSDITDHLGLQAGRALGTDVLNHARAMGVQADTFGTLLEVMLRRLALSNVRPPAHLRLQYCHQGSGDPIGTEDVPFEEPALRAELQGYLAYWTGNREARGVDIEDAWKCQSCHYQASCEWKKNNFPTAHSHEKP